jgi:hypothetical protein
MAEHAERQIYRQKDMPLRHVCLSVCLFVCLSVYLSISVERQKQEEPVLLLLIFCQIHKIGFAQTLIILSDVKKSDYGFF